MLTVQEVIEIYARDGVDVSEKEAAEDLARALSDKPDYFKLVRRIEGYAKQHALESYASGREAAEFETNYQ